MKKTRLEKTRQLRNIPKEVRAPAQVGRKPKWEGGSKREHVTVSKRSAAFLDQLADLFDDDRSQAAEYGLELARLAGSKGIHAISERRRHAETENLLLNMVRDRDRIVDSLVGDRDRLLVEVRRLSYYAGRRVERLSSKRLRSMEREIAAMEQAVYKLTSGLDALAVIELWAQKASSTAQRVAEPPP